MIGVPVCIELKDGSCYVGRIAGIDKGQLLFSGKRSRKLRPPLVRLRASKASVSGLFPGLGAFMGMPGALQGAAAEPGAAAAPTGAGAGGLLGGFGGLTEFMGMMNKAMPMIRMGMSMVKTIMPLMNGLKG
jgi:hypothetical protein